jgi:pilus assembly protein CpaF
VSLAERVARARATRDDVVEPDRKEELALHDDALATFDRADADLVSSIVAVVRERLSEISDRAALSDERFRVLVEGQVADVLSEPRFATTIEAQQKLRSAVTDELLGFGPIQDLLDDRGISEIMVNGMSGIYIESGGVLRKTNLAFESLEQLMRVIDRMVRSSGRRVDQSSPMVDTRLPDGSRLNVILPPLAVDGPSVTIRKFTASDLGIEDLVRFDTLSGEAADFLQRAVASRLNILVSGGTGTGKTTVLNILSTFIGATERVVTIEDAVELTLRMPNLIRLETRPANSEGAGEVSIRDLVRNALRMRPNRIVVGEVRGGETIDMLQAMNTGHEGSLSTVHANSPRDAARRLETMILLGGVELPLRAIREQISSSIDLVVHLARDARGRRFVTTIAEMEGMEGDVISMAELYARSASAFASTEVLPPLVSTGLVPTRFAVRGNRVSA